MVDYFFLQRKGYIEKEEKQNNTYINIKNNKKE